MQFLLLSLVVAILTVSANEVKLVKFTTCKGFENAPISFHNLVLSSVKGGKVSVSGDTCVKKEISGPVAILVCLTSCTNRENPQTCKLHACPKVDDICKEMEKDKDCILANIFKMWGMEPECPIRSGTFRFPTSIFKFPSIVDAMAQTKPYWRANVTFTAGNKIIWCAEFQFECFKPTHGKYGG